MEEALIGDRVVLRVSVPVAAPQAPAARVQLQEGAWDLVQQVHRQLAADGADRAGTSAAAVSLLTLAGCRDAAVTYLDGHTAWLSIEAWS